MGMTLSEVEAKIRSLLESPEVDYQIGDMRVSASQKLKQLLEYRRELKKRPTASQAIVSFNLDVNEFGEEQGEYEQ